MRLLRCPVCQSKHIIRRGVVLRKIRTVPIGRKPVWILVEIHRIFCLDCKALRQIHTRIATPKRSYTWAFERFVLDLYRVMTLKDIAAFLGISWDCVKDIVKRNLNRRFSKPSLKNGCCNKFSGAIFAITFGSKLWKGVNPGNGYQSN